MKKLGLLLTSLLVAASSSMPAFASQNEIEEIMPRYNNTGYVYYCVGTGTYSSEYIDTTTEAVTARDYIQKWGYDCDPKYNVYKNPLAKEIQEGRLNSPVVLFAGHGSNTNVDCGDSGIEIGERYSPFVCIDDFNFDVVELAFLAACKTAQTVGGIAAKFPKNGALYSIGWKGSPQSAHLTNFVKAYFKAIDNNKTFIQAEQFAKSEVLKTTSGQDSAEIYTFNSFGEKNATVYKYTRSAEDIKSFHDLFLDESIEQYTIEPGKLIYVDGSNDFEAVCEYIKENIDPGFNQEDYKISEIAVPEDGTIGHVIINYMVDGIMSDFFYDVICDDNEAFIINVLGKNITNNPPKIGKASLLTEDEIYRMAMEELNIKDPISKYHMDIVYDTNNGKIRYEMEIEAGSDEMGYTGHGFTYME